MEVTRDWSCKKITNPDASEFSDRYPIFSSGEINYDTGENRYTVPESGDEDLTYAFGNPDFNFRQFRSNLIVRWEYLSGSTVFWVGRRAEPAPIQMDHSLMETM